MGSCRDRLTLRQFTERSGVPFRELVADFAHRHAESGSTLPDQDADEPRWMSGTEAAVAPDLEARSPDEETP